MHLKNPFMLLIILFTAVFISTFYVYKFLIQPAGAIYLTHEIPEPYDSSNFHIVSVVAEDLKVPFFGTAFHINYDSQNYSYDHFSLGNYFTAQDDPLVLVNEISNHSGEPAKKADARIITGISLKRGQTINKSDGVLLKIYFKNKNSIMDQSNDNDFYFSNAVFSTFDKERKDLKNITFYP